MQALMNIPKPEILATELLQGWDYSGFGHAKAIYLAGQNTSCCSTGIQWPYIYLVEAIWWSDGSFDYPNSMVGSCPVIWIFNRRLYLKHRVKTISWRGIYLWEVLWRAWVVWMSAWMGEMTIIILSYTHLY